MNRVPVPGTVIAVCGLVIGAIGCESSQPAPQPQTQAAPKAVSDADRVAFYQDCWKLFSTHDFAKFKGCYADTAVSMQSGYGSPKVTGPDAIVNSSMEFAKAFPDIAGEGQLILVDGPRIASVFLLKGTNSGPMAGPGGQVTPATNKKLGVYFGHIVDLEPNAMKVTMETGINDGGTVAAQLGLVKMPARPVVEHGATSPLVVMARNDATEEANMKAEATQLEAWNRHDIAGVKNYFDPGLVFHDFGGPADQNLAQTLDSISGFWKGFSDLHLTYAETWPAADYVVMTGTLTGTNDGPFPPLTAKKTGKKVNLPFIEIDRLKDGKVAEVWLFYDSATFAGQLGLGGM